MVKKQKSFIYSQFTIHNLPYLPASFQNMLFRYIVNFSNLKSDPDLVVVGIFILILKFITPRISGPSQIINQQDIGAVRKPYSVVVAFRVGQIGINIK